MRQLLNYSALLLVVFTLACCNESSNKLKTLQVQIESLQNQLNLYKEKYGEINSESNSGSNGIWKINYYVDSFGDPTNEGYITNSDIIVGTFSNSATTDSELGVSFLITNKDDIAIKLYEYMNNNPVKDDGLYVVSIKDSSNKTYSLNAFNSSDRLVFSESGFYDETGNKLLEKSHAVMMWKLLIKGEELKFNIQKSDTPTTIYNFSIPKTNGLEQLYLELTKKK